MTQRDNPVYNAEAERLNNILKNERFKDMTIKDIEQIWEALGKAVQFYNNELLHLSPEMRTTVEAAREKGCFKRQ